MPVLVTLVLLTGGSVVTALSAAARDPLPDRTAAELLTDLQGAKLDGFSGRVQHTADLGLPALPGIGGRDSSDLSSLLAGSHTLRVWYADPEHVRVALMGDVGESAVVRNGTDLWTWSSKDRKASHRTVPETTREVPENVGALTGLDPRQVAEFVLSAITPTTRVTTDGTAEVAGRSAYELVVEPKDARSLVAEVRISVDSETSIPTRVRVLAKDREAPAFEVGFTSFDPSTPDGSNFEFEPPPGTEVTEVTEVPGGHDPAKSSPDKPEGPGTKSGPGRDSADSAGGPKVVGTGWTTVVVTELPQVAGGQDDLVGQMLEALPPVSGDWGSGRLLRGTLFTALLSEDGRLAVGAVPPKMLYAALSAP